MSWLYSQALAEEYSEANSLDGEQYVQLNGNHTPQAYCSPDRMIKFSRLFRFGMMYKPLTEDLGKELLTLYLEDFRAKTFQVLEKEQELTDNAAQCGSTWQESSTKSNQLMLSLRIPLCSALEDSVLSCKTLPKWGMMQDGELFPQPPLVQITKGIECGSWLPTPTCHNAKEGNYPAERNRNTPLLATHVGGKIHPEFTEWMMGWPLGWTDLKPLETDKCLCAPQQLGIF